MSKFKTGDTVTIAAREQTPSDIKSGLYFPHYGGLTGSLLKVYGEEAAVLVDRDSLPEAIRKRHEENEKAQRQRWLDSLSEEARNRLSANDKQFALNYAILVSVNDVAAGRPAAKTDAAPAADDAVPTPPRKTAEDLEAAEAAFLASRQNA